MGQGHRYERSNNIHNIYIYILGAPGRTTSNKVRSSKPAAGLHLAPRRPGRSARCRGYPAHRPAANEHGHSDGSICGVGSRRGELIGLLLDLKHVAVASVCFGVASGDDPWTKGPCSPTEMLHCDQLINSSESAILSASWSGFPDRPGPVGLQVSLAGPAFASGPRHSSIRTVSRCYGKCPTCRGV